MYMYVFMYIYIYIYICIHVCGTVCMHVWVRICIQLYTIGVPSIELIQRRTPKRVEKKTKSLVQITIRAITVFSNPTYPSIARYIPFKGSI